MPATLHGCQQQEAASKAALPLLHVFKRLRVLRDLASVAQVSKEWRHAAWQPELWRSLDLSGRQNAAPLLLQAAQSPQLQAHLREVNLEFAAGIKDVHLALLRPFSLEALNLNGCQRLSQAAIVGLVSRQPALQSLQLYWNLNIKDAALTALAAASPQLRRLSLSGCKNVTDAGLRSLAGACTQLTYLDLTRCLKLTEKGLVALAENCRQLQELRLYACSQVTDSCLRAFGRLPQLQLIDLCGGHLLTDAGIAALADCHQLRSVNLTWCIQLTDEGCVRLAAGCPGLELLSLHGILGVTDRTVEALAASCKATLHTLDVNGCTGIRRKGQAELRAQLPQLRTFLVHT